MTSFRKFILEFSAIQQETLKSWQAQDIQVIAPDNEYGLSGSCPGVTLLKGVKTARDLGFKSAVPVMPYLLKESLKFITTPLMGIIDSDVAIGSFSEELDRIIEKNGFNIFLTDAHHDFILLSKFNIKRMLRDMPDLLMGRYGCDTWMVNWGKKHVSRALDDGLTLRHIGHSQRYKWLQEGRNPASDDYNRRLLNEKN